MQSDRELLKQALEALEWCRGEDLAWVNEPEFFTEAITNLLEQLAQPEQRREWQGLTDEEIKMLPQWFPSHETAAVMPLIRAVEAKLRERNT